MFGDIKNKKVIILLIIVIIFFGIKTNFFRNSAELIKYNHSERLVKEYGFCSNESIGFLKYLKIKYDIKDNPKIINYVHAPGVSWSIVNTKNINKVSEKTILLNYPGLEFKSYLSKVNESLFEFSELYFLSNKFKKINYIEITNNVLKKVDIEMSIYTIDENKNKKIIETLNINSLRTPLNLDAAKITKKSKLFFKIKYQDKFKDKNLNFFINLQNKYDLKDHYIIEKKNSCYYIK